MLGRAGAAARRWRRGGCATCRPGRCSNKLFACLCWHAPLPGSPYSQQSSWDLEIQKTWYSQSCGEVGSLLGNSFPLGLPSMAGFIHYVRSWQKEVIRLGLVNVKRNTIQGRDRLHLQTLSILLNVLDFYILLVLHVTLIALLSVLTEGSLTSWGSCAFSHVKSDLGSHVFLHLCWRFKSWGCPTLLAKQWYVNMGCTNKIWFDPYSDAKRGQ